MQPFTFRPPESEAEAAQQMMMSIISWLPEFCTAQGFLKPNGQTNIARALNLAGGHAPKTKKEREFLAALLAETEKRLPGDHYPAACLRAPADKP